MYCIYCYTPHVQKNGVLPRGGQRYACVSCNKNFTLGGEGRGTYTQSFKDAVVHMYCHIRLGAREVAKKFQLSSATLISRSKDHKKNCKKCKHST